MRFLAALFAVLFAAHPAYAVEVLPGGSVSVPSQDEFDALDGRVRTLEQQSPEVTPADIEGLQQQLDALRGVVEGHHAPDPEPDPEPDPLPSAVAGANITDCVAQLDAQGGGWCEMKVSDAHPSISSVWPQDMDSRMRMNSGPVSVLTAWSGAAFDAENLLLYFMGGGHADYGGNEVYEFDLKTGTWTRLTDPSPLEYVYVSSYGDNKHCWSPDLRTLPGSAHTYDGVQFSRLTGTVFVAMSGAANGSCFIGDPPAGTEVVSGQSRGHGIFEFNPSRDNARNGLEPLTWRRLTDWQSINLNYPRSVELPDGQILIGNRTDLSRFNPVTGNVGGLAWRIANYGPGLAVHHPSGALVSLHDDSLVVRRPGEDTQAIDTPRLAGNSLALDGGGTVFSWGGGSAILAIDIDDADPRWQYYDWAGHGPYAGNNRVYSKWQYVAEHGVFVGLSTHETGVWVYQHPEDMEPTELATIDAQQLINQAEAGSEVTIPPGTYIQGLSVRKSLTLNLEGVALWGVADRKGVINIGCDGCEVVINDLQVDGGRAGCAGGNCAGIKIAGVDWHVVVNRAVISKTANGILTDNRGGHLEVRESSLADIHCLSAGEGQEHGLYAGEIDQLDFVDSNITQVCGLGHVLKSRAAVTNVLRSDLIGGTDRHSRVVDLPCGGAVTITESHLENGALTDNAELMSYAIEQDNCQELRHESITFNDSTVLARRVRYEGPAGSHGPTTLVQWRSQEADPAENIILDNTLLEGIEFISRSRYGPWPDTPLP